MKILPSKADLPRLSGWIFVAVWWFGAVSMIGGLEMAEGFWGVFTAICAFAVACVAWWGTDKLSGYRSDGGFIVIALWMLGPISALLDFRFYVASPFFWTSSSMLVTLILVAATCRSHLKSKAGF